MYALPQPPPTPGGIGGVRGFTCEFRPIHSSSTPLKCLEKAGLHWQKRGAEDETCLYLFGTQISPRQPHPLRELRAG